MVDRRRLLAMQARAGDAQMDTHLAFERVISKWAPFIKMAAELVHEQHPDVDPTQTAIDFGKDLRDLVMASTAGTSAESRKIMAELVTKWPA